MNPRVPITVLALAIVSTASSALARENAGFLYGTVVTESGSEYRGFLRWGTQEAFWDDLFHSRKDELPYLEVARDLANEEGEPEPRRNRVRVFKFQIEWEGSPWGTSRVFVARFGDIERIEVTGDQSADVHLRSGEVVAVTGYADDVGGEIKVIDDRSETTGIEWDRIETIRFEQAPRGADPGAQRLFGTLQTTAGAFEGYVTWDKEEGLTTDMLDGDDEDGSVSLPMGQIQSIERRGRRASIVQMQDGRRMRLRGSNDVDSDNRGIMVEDERFGKLTVPWDEFDRLDLQKAPGSGRGRDEYPKPTELRGRVRDSEGETHAGRLVFDLDEASTWEILNGMVRDIEFDIPFAMVASIRPDGEDASIVELRSGERLVLEDSQDVTDRNAGVLVYTSEDADPVHVQWKEIEFIEFDR